MSALQCECAAVLAEIECLDAGCAAVLAAIECLDAGDWQRASVWLRLADEASAELGV